MTRIGLLSDTHGYLDENIFRHFEACDEVWHAGDFGDASIIKKLQNFKPLKAVWGNIDGPDVRAITSETLQWQCEAVPVFMTHIGGYPGRYAPGIKKHLEAFKPKLFICGHSHILKIMFDAKLQCLHMNPGACGHQGWHTLRTLIRFTIDGADIKDCEVIELGKRGTKTI